MSWTNMVYFCYHFVIFIRLQNFYLFSYVDLVILVCFTNLSNPQQTLFLTMVGKYVFKNCVEGAK